MNVVSHGYTATSDAKAKQYSRPRLRQGSLQGLKEASGFFSVIRVFKEFTGENDKAPDAMTRFRLNRWLYALCWTGTESPGDAF
jgi:hypothetical protein